MKHESTSTGLGPAGRRLIHLFALMLALSVSASAQLSSSTTSGTTPLGIAPGAPAGSYALSGFESVNPYNGALNFRLPLLHVGGRGGVQHVITLAVEQHWRVDKNKLSTPGYLYDPQPNRWSTFDPGFGPGTLVGRRTGLSQAQGELVYCPDDAIALTRFTFTAPDGTEYELRDAQSNGQTMDNVYQADPGSQFSCQLVTTHYRGRVFATSDGSAATFISDTDINDHSETGDPFSLPQELVYPAGYLFMRDGTCYRIDGGKVLWIRDRNGNRMTFSYGVGGVFNITDSLNRVVTIDYSVHDPVRNQNYDLITYKGFGGAARTIKLWYSKLKFALRPDFGTEAKTYEFLFLALDGSADTAYNPRVVAEIELPDGRKYLLNYNWYGELARVDLPTGGRIEYDYDAGVTGGDPKGVVIGVNSGGTVKNVYRRVTERRVYKDAGTTLELKETYSRPENDSGGNQGYVEVQHLAADGVTILAREKHYYFGSPKSSFVEEAYQYSNWKDGKEYKTEFFEKNSTGANGLLRTVENTWQQPAAANTWPLTGQGETSDTAKPNQPQITAVTTTLNDTTPNLISKQTFTYDQYTNRTEVKEYDLGPSAPGSLVRRSATAYLTNNLGVNYATVNPSTTNPDPNATVHIRSLPLQESVYDSGTAEKARTTYEYDNYTGGLWDRSDITGHARMLGAQATHTASYVTRGNATQVTRVVLGTPEVSLSTRMQYDIAGNVRSVTDPKTNTTTFEFDDRYGSPDTEAESNTVPTELSNPPRTTYAFATKVTNALTQNAYTQYDYYLGKPVNSEDANGIVAKGRYDDLLDRATGVDTGIFTGSQLQHHTSFVYNDTSHLITTQSDQTTLNDGVLTSTIVYDGLGRTTETRTSAPEGTIYTSQEYDAMGRVKRTYNPYRTTGDPTYGYADTAYDGLGRVLTVTTSDGAVVTTSYSGSATTVTDQAGKTRRSITDGLGRLIRVDEPDSAGSLGTVASPTQPTSYVYDVLDDLTTVTQGTQPSRSFAYDSLKRLTDATNPESGHVHYIYDANSNLATKLDARSITTTYFYDALNRVTKRTYSDSTPEVDYYYDNQTLPTNKPPNFTPAYSTGRLIAVCYGGASSSAGSYQSYDKLGRVTSSYQQTDSQNYGFGYGYNLASEMTSETYPSGRQVITEYDTAGRIAGVKKDATTYYAGATASDATNRIQYAPQGAVSVMKLGNGKWEHTNFNNRLQPTQIGLGTSSTDSSVLKLDYGYGATANNGNVVSQTITAPSLTLTQCYSYDSLNRLSTADEHSGTTCAGAQQWKQAFTYDRFGNRNFDVVNTTANVLGPNPTISQSTNRIGAGQNYGYDNGGNLTSDPATNANGIVYDAENRQTQYTKSQQATNYYYYDGDGHRVKKIDSSGTTVFMYNAGGQLIAEYASGTPSGGGTSYLTSDHLGSTRVVMKSDGSAARHDYLPFGEEISSTIGGRGGVAGYGAMDSTRQRFTQKERDNESGLDYFLARYYSSAQGRFTSPDPIILSDKQIVSPQTWNLYNYAGNNPLAYTDPTGMERVRLGQHTDEEIDRRRKEIDQQIKQGKKDGTLTKEQKRQLEAEKKTLGLEKDGNRLVGNLLARLPADERQGLQVSDFTLSTDTTGTDFMSDPAFVTGAGGAGAAQTLADAAGTKAMFVVRGYSKEIFINTATSNIRDMMSGDRDWITYGATLVKHEQSHRDKLYNEFQAYTEQKRVLDQFGPGGFSSREVYQRYADSINRQIEKYKPKP